jgi:hypothetical protein
LSRSEGNETRPQDPAAHVGQHMSVVTPVNWVTVLRFCDITGYTVDAVDKKRQQGVWLEGNVWKHAPDNRILISIEGYHAWVEGT